MGYLLCHTNANTQLPHALHKAATLHALTNTLFFFPSRNLMKYGRYTQKGQAIQLIQLLSLTETYTTAFSCKFCVQ